MKKTTNDVAVGRNRQKDTDKDVAYHTKDTTAHLGHFAKPSILKAGHNTDPMPKPTPGPRESTGSVGDYIHDLVVPKSKQYQITPKQPPARAEASPKPAKSVLETGGMGADQQSTMKGAIDAQEGR